MITQWTSSDYQTITNGKWHGLPPQGGTRQSIEFDHRCLDKDGLFLALQGGTRNGHEFVCQLDEAQWALVEQIDETASAAQLVVDDVLVSAKSHDANKGA